MTPLEASAPWAISQAYATRRSPLAPLCRVGLPRLKTGSLREGGAWADREPVMCNGLRKVMHGSRRAITFLGYISSKSKAEKRHKQSIANRRRWLQYASSASAVVNVASRRSARLLRSCTSQRQPPRPCLPFTSTLQLRKEPASNSGCFGAGQRSDVYLVTAKLPHEGSDGLAVVGASFRRSSLHHWRLTVPTRRAPVSIRSVEEGLGPERFGRSIGSFVQEAPDKLQLANSAMRRRPRAVLLCV